jgi:transaldolase
LVSGSSVTDAYWDLVVTDIKNVLTILRPVYDASNGVDGYVSIEVSPLLARDTTGTAEAARHLHGLINEPNLYIKIPGTEEGLPAIKAMISEGVSVNVTLLFSLERYREVMEAYISGLEARQGDLSEVSSVASFFISRVDSEADKRLDALGSEDALALKGKVAVANAQVAYEAFLETFSGPRWDALVARGARPQRPLWASTSTKNPSYPDTLYVDSLIGPQTVNTIPDQTLEDFDNHGTVARTVDADLPGAHSVLEAFARLGLSLADVTAQLEDEGVASFSKSFDDLLATLDEKAKSLK